MALIQIGISVCNFQSVTQKRALTMTESGKILEYSEGDLEIQERLNEINVDQRVLTTWHRLAKVYKIEEMNEYPVNLIQGGSFRYMLGSGRQRVLPGLDLTLPN